MSQATRCPGCGTVFRVVKDQLRVSEGWVRCGRCTEVFNAVDHPVDLQAEALALALRQRGSASMPGAGSDASMGVSPTHLRSGAPEGLAGDDMPIGGVEADVDLDWPDRGPAAPAPAPAPAPSPVLATAPPPAPPPAAAAVPPHSSLDDSGQAGEAADTASSTADIVGTQAADPLSTGEPTVDLRADAHPPPAFVRKADAAARWRRPVVRAALASLVGLGLLGLGLQIVIEYRDLAAARWPEARGLLSQACDRLGCRLEAPRLVDALAVEGSGLLRIEGSKVYRLSVVLKNRAPLAVAVPSVELVLTDTQGRLVTRRVLQPGELGLRMDALPAGSEWPLQALLEVDAPSVSGYTIELFHP